MKHENRVLQAIKASSLSVQEMAEFSEKLKRSLEEMNNQPYFITYGSQRVFKYSRYIISNPRIIKNRIS